MYAIRSYYAVLAKGLDAFFSEVTPAKLKALLCQELGQEERLDRFSSDGCSGPTTTISLARGPSLLVQLTAGNIPSPALSSMLMGLLVRAAQFVKCAQGRNNFV